jgi:anti-sigma regulatory factor (Ser/Thr protein kinase)
MNTAAAAAPAAPQLELCVPASAEGVAQGVHDCEQFLQQHGVLPQARMRLSLVLEEAVMNLAMHGHPAPGHQHAQVTLRLLPDALELALRDDGLPFDPQTAPLPERPSTLDEARPGGLGVALMRRFSRAMHYERVDGQNCLTMRLDRV